MTQFKIQNSSWKVSYGGKPLLQHWIHRLQNFSQNSKWISRNWLFGRVRQCDRT